MWWCGRWFCQGEAGVPCIDRGEGCHQDHGQEEARGMAVAHHYLTFGTIYCGCLYFRGYQFSLIEHKSHHSWGSKFVVIVFSFIMHTENHYFVDRTLHENHESWYPTKIKPSTVCAFVFSNYPYSILPNQLFY